MFFGFAETKYLESWNLWLPENLVSLEMRSLAALSACRPMAVYMDIYIYIMHIYIYIYIYISMSLYIYIYTHTHIYVIKIDTYIYIHIHTHTYIYICICVYMYVSLYGFINPKPQALSPKP